MERLVDCEVTCVLPVKDLERARAFYEQVLGLQPLGPRGPGKFVFRAGGTDLALLHKRQGTKAEHTAVSFRVERIEPVVASLQACGIAFADYDLPGLKTVGHVAVLGAEKAAWFHDPEGNILCIHEDLA